MAAAPHIVQIESSLAAKRVAAAVALSLGVGLAWFASGASGAGALTQRAAFWLGCLLAVLGAGLWLFGGQQMVRVDGRRRMLSLSQAGLFARAERVYLFKDIAAFDLDEWGDDEGGSRSYDVVMTLRTGKRISLFAGFFDGRHDPVVMRRHRDRLAALVFAHQDEASA